jgi:uncharacterized protein (DUF1778 family)
LHPRLDACPAKETMNAKQERRRRRLSLRVSARERSTLETAAERAGLCLSDYLRRILIAARPLRARRRPALETHLAAKLLVQLGALTAQLRAIAQNLGTPLMPFVERDLARALVELRDCRRQLLKALGRKP